MKKLYFIILFFFALPFFVQPVLARPTDQITDWYIKDFQAEIIVNKDSSLLITENIIADCGNLPNKHGIFRVLPTKIKTEKETFKTPINLISITDSNGKPHAYKIIKGADTITWKIGDSDIEVTGENYYKIVYKVNNAIRFGNADFDEFYWNLMGNFWDISTDSFSANIIFPSEVNQQNSEVEYYTGDLGSKSKSLVNYLWSEPNVLNFSSVATLQPRQGITVSVAFPKNIFTPYQPSFFEKYGEYFWYLSFLLPIAIFWFAFSTWKKYGNDPKMKKPIPPEFGIPDLSAQAGNITPLQMGMVLSSGRWRDKFVTASIIDFAVRGYIIIEQLEEKILFFKNKDYKIEKTEKYSETDFLTKPERVLLDKIFGGKNIIKLSELKKNFYKDIPEIKRAALEEVVEKGWVVKKGKIFSILFFVLGVALLPLSIFFGAFSFLLFSSVFVSGFLLLVFAFIMPKRTQAGVDLLFKIKGFELYMKKAEDFRQQFYEKENIFDKFLPYAIIFGIAELWAKKMQLIYGQDYYKNYHPVWFIGGSYGDFNVNSFVSELNSITTSISQSTSSASGAGGAGGAGGGGGGGGGGGW